MRKFLIAALIGVAFAVINGFIDKKPKETLPEQLARLSAKENSMAPRMFGDNLRLDETIASERSIQYLFTALVSQVAESDKAALSKKFRTDMLPDLCKDPLVQGFKKANVDFEMTIRDTERIEIVSAIVNTSECR